MKEIIEHEIPKIMEALLSLAKHIERCPYNDFKVEREILDILDLQKLSLGDNFPSKNKE